MRSRGFALAGAMPPRCPAPGRRAAPSAHGSAQGSRTTAYQAAYFAQFAPRTAFDIVQHVPGFQLDLGSTQSATGSVDVRGFAGTAGNVVINGARPSTKSETLDVTLQRIPAQRVLRVELGSGDLYGSDYAGKSQVLNVVLSNAAGFDANVTARRTLRRYKGYIQPNVSANVVISKGSSTFNFSARNRQQQAIRRRHGHADRRGDRQISSSSAASTTSIITGTRPLPRPTASNTARTTPTISIFAGSRAASICSRRNRVSPTGRAAARRQPHPALQGPGDRARRRRHPAASRWCDQVCRAGDPPQAPRLRPVSFSAMACSRMAAKLNGGFEQSDRRQAQRDHRPPQLDPVRPSWECRSKPVRKAHTTPSTTISTLDTH